MVYSLLGHLIIVTVFYIYFRARKDSRLTRSAAGNFFKSWVEKTYHFWMKKYLIWEVGGGF